MSKIICSHGFGVRADARGLFTDINAAFPQHQFVMFDYNTVTDNGNVLVAPINIQVAMLQQQLAEHVDVEYILAHSQGCMTVALATLPKLKGVVLLTPPTNMSIERMLEQMAQRTGAKINPSGMSEYPRSDGSVTYVPSEYLQSLAGKNPTVLYDNLSKDQPVTIVRAANDQVLGETDFSSIANVKLATITDGDHDLTGAARSELIELLKMLFV